MTTSFLETITGAEIAIGIGRTLADCQTVAAMFDNTCTDGPVVLADHAGVEMSCSGQMMCPLGDGSVTYTTDNPCTFTRKLCISCTQDSNNDVYINVQNNQMPNHCFQATN